MNIFEKKLTTQEGEILVKVTFNEFWSEYQLNVDGSLMASSKNKEWIISEALGMF